MASQDISLALFTKGNEKTGQGTGLIISPMKKLLFFTNKVWFLCVVVMDECVDKELVAGKTLGCVSQQPNSGQAHKSESIEMFLRPTDPEPTNTHHDEKGPNRNLRKTTVIITVRYPVPK